MASNVSTYRNKVGLFLIGLSILALLIPQLSNSFVIGDYLINQDFYAKVLCVNKSKPELNCNGKCSLMSKLKSNENQPKNNTSLLEKQLEILWVSFEKFPEHLPATSNTRITANSSSNKPCGSYASDIFRPPCV
jgi:hypothetical protein